MAEHRGRLPSATSPQQDSESSHQFLLPPDSEETQLSELIDFIQNVPGPASAATAGDQLPDSGLLDQHLAEEALLFPMLPPESNRPVIDLEDPMQQMMPPPSGRAPINPNINLAMSISGGFQKDSPLHNWIVGSEKVYPRDPTQTTLVNAICKILSDPNANESFNWVAMPNEQSFVRIDMSIWIGERRAPSSWNRLNVPGGWRRETRNVLEHVGDPRLCSRCERTAEIENMRKRIQELEAKLESERGKSAKRQADYESDDERPAKRIRKEPTRGRARGRPATGRGTVRASGRGSRGGRGGRTRKALPDPHQSTPQSFAGADAQMMTGFPTYEQQMLANFPPAEQQVLSNYATSGEHLLSSNYSAYGQQVLQNYPTHEQQSTPDIPVHEQQIISEFLAAEQDVVGIPDTPPYRQPNIDPERLTRP